MGVDKTNRLSWPPSSNERASFIGEMWPIVDWRQLEVDRLQESKADSLVDVMWCDELTVATWVEYC